MPRKGNPAWVKGKSGNPKGRPKAGEQFADILDAYLMKKAKQEGNTHWIEHVVDMAWEDPRLMASVIKKLIPDKSEADLNVKGNLIVEVVKFAADKNP